MAKAEDVVEVMKPGRGRLKSIIRNGGFREAHR
jgi:hypothetical protein